MNLFKPFSLNIGGHLVEVSRPLVMGILNVTPDSFYAGSRCCCDEARIAARVRQMIDEGADLIDIGGYSSRPGADDVTPDEEFARLSTGLKVIRKVAPDTIVSVDTFRASVAERCVVEYGAAIINDISAGCLDPEMLQTVARLKTPYIMMHMRGTPHTMATMTDYDDVTAEVLRFLGQRIRTAAHAGICDIIADPGFGFSKDLDQNYRLMAGLGTLAALDVPLLVGVSRKSMIYNLLHTTPQDALNGTTVLNTIALLNGASILRVHDVRQAAEAVQIVCEYNNASPNVQPAL